MDINILLIPPVAFLIYVGLLALLNWLSGTLAAKGDRSVERRSIYTGGESFEAYPAVPGYQRFFVVALFFAVLHLGALIIGISSPNSTAAGAVILALILILTALLPTRPGRDDTDVSH